MAFGQAHGAICLEEFDVCVFGAQWAFAFCASCKDDAELRRFGEFSHGLEDDTSTFVPTAEIGPLPFVLRPLFVWDESVFDTASWAADAKFLQNVAWVDVLVEVQPDPGSGSLGAIAAWKLSRDRQPWCLKFECKGTFESLSCC